jgi:ATP-dependent 26S proteasome regulatory subunit
MPVEVDIDNLTKKYDNLSGSDISTAVMKAALNAAKENQESVTEIDFEVALKSIINSKNANSTSNEKVQRVTEVIPESEVPESIRKKADERGV